MPDEAEAAASENRSVDALGLPFQRKTPANGKMAASSITLCSSHTLRAVTSLQALNLFAFRDEH
jgi:hypothetical protein